MAEIAIVVLERNRRRYLEMVLSALCRQDIPLSRFRVIVVDNGSSEPLLPVVESFGSKLEIGCIRIDKAISRAAARNRGLAEVVESNVLLLDGDTLPDGDLVRRHLSVLADEGVVASLGARREHRPGTLHTQPLPPGASLTSFAALHDCAQQDLRIPAIEQRVIRENFDRICYFFFYTHNVAIRRSTVIASGGFNEDLTGWGLEDLEFGFRVREQLASGESIRWSPQAGSAHIPHLRDFGANLSELVTNQVTLLRHYKSFHWEGHRTASPDLECVRIIMAERLAEVFAKRAVVGREMPEVERWAGVEAGNSLLLGVGTMSGWHGIPAACRSSLADWRDRSVSSFCGTQFLAGDGSLCNVVNVDVWRALPWHHVSEMLAEAMRVSESAIFVSSLSYDKDLAGIDRDSGSGPRFVEDADFLANALSDFGLDFDVFRCADAAAVRVWSR
ncbi:glycosyltransferase [Amycolatopsis tolypomycina]|uniref:glycosyltransferase n=1 Tax=Amycolatopsis tolypomycina TaxID=208445 RepID=UPI0033A7C3E7